MEISNIAPRELPENALDQINQQISRLQMGQSPVAQDALILRSKFEHAVESGDVDRASRIYRKVIGLR